MIYKIIFMLFIVTFVVGSKHDQYKGYKVYTFNLTSAYQRDNFDHLKSDVIDYWILPNLELKRAGRVMVPASHQSWFEENLRELGMPVEVLIQDVYEYLMKKENEDSLQRNLENQMILSRRSRDRVYNLTRYLRYNEILEYALDLQEEFLTSPNISLDVVAFSQNTFQNRELFYLKLTSSSAVAEPKPVIVIEAASVAREWITVPSAMYIVDMLLEDEQYQLLEEFEWIVIPVLNPDGYEFSHTNTRLWIKSRRTNLLPLVCVGVNINRNFDIDFGNFDSSTNYCSDTYDGGSPFSEPESQFVQSIVEEYRDRIKLYISLQNKGGLITYPWSYERAASALFKQHHMLALSMISVMNGNYTVGVSSVAIERASGTSSDYVRRNGVRYTFNLDIGSVDNNVVIPVQEIPTIVEDVWWAVSTAAREIVY
ncbi:carboxypeptidase B [Amyelois transitella]|uniref:carboxypeptidase B n=1 Tax=Amyelois transitella TaxID=680683 RepID=UPI0029906FF2|nr:carboxypeptidase B [Amyelois transitella]